MKKNKLLSLILTISLTTATLLTGCGSSSSGENGQVIVYNWGEYISDGSEGSSVPASGVMVIG